MERHRRLLAAYLRGGLPEAVREELGAWLDNAWWALTKEEQQAVDTLGSADITGVIDLPDLGYCAPHRCMVAAEGA